MDIEIRKKAFIHSTNIFITLILDSLTETGDKALNETKILGIV